MRITPKRISMFSKYLLRSIIPGNDRDPFFGIPSGKLTKAFEEHEIPVKTVHSDWKNVPYETTFYEATNTKFTKPDTLAIITGITLPEYPENDIASSLVKKLFSQMINNDSDYVERALGVYDRSLRKKSMFKTNPAIYINLHGNFNNNFQPIDSDTQLVSANTEARRIIDCYLGHKKSLLELLDGIDTDYPVTQDEAEDFVRKHRLPSQILEDSYEVYEESDLLSNEGYSNFIPPCGGIAKFPKYWLLDTIPNGNKFYFSLPKKEQENLYNQIVEQRYLLINGVLQRDPADTSEQDFITKEAPRLIGN